MEEEFIEQLKKDVRTQLQPQIVLPGEDVLPRITASSATSSGQIRLGSGLRHETISNEEEMQMEEGLAPQTQAIVSCNLGGVLRHKLPNSYFVENVSKRYIPAVGDQVVGIIEDKGGDFYRVNIFSPSSAMLGRLSFEGATKRNKPELSRGFYF